MRVDVEVPILPNPFVLKLACGADLGAQDRETLREISSRSRPVGAKSHIIGEGDRPGDVHLVMQGYACRSKVLPDGSRQIMALLLPGDFCDLHVAILGEMDHDIVTLTPCQVVDIPRREVLALSNRSSALTRALWWSTLTDEGTLREWLANIGRRSAEERLAHLFCELMVRLRAVGLADEVGYDLPLKQEELADALGLSVVHVNRVLQNLRREGLVVWQGARLEIPDFERLSVLASFDPNYLHLNAACLDVE